MHSPKLKMNSIIIYSKYKNMLLNDSIFIKSNLKTTKHDHTRREKERE